MLSSPWAEECRIDEDIFFEPGHLHLTLAMLKLYSDERRHKAKRLVDDAGAAIRAILAAENAAKDGDGDNTGGDNIIGGGGGIRVAVKGLEYMNDDPSEVDVLYLQVAEVRDTGVLARVCQTVVDIYGRGGGRNSYTLFKDPTLCTICSWALMRGHFVCGPCARTPLKHSSHRKTVRVEPSVTPQKEVNAVPGRSSVIGERSRRGCPRTRENRENHERSKNTKKK